MLFAGACQHSMVSRSVLQELANTAWSFTLFFTRASRHHMDNCHIVHNSSPTPHGRLLCCLKGLANQAWSFTLLFAGARQHGMGNYHVVYRSSPTPHERCYVVCKSLPTQHGHCLFCLQELANTAWSLATLFTGARQLSMSVHYGVARARQHSMGVLRCSQELIHMVRSFAMVFPGPRQHRTDTSLSVM